MLFSSWLDFGSTPIVWWLIGHLFLGSLTIWLLIRKRPLAEAFFGGAFFIISGFMRLPVFLYNLPTNPDESQMLAQGLTLTVDPLLYRSVDPTTSGPINSYLLSFVHLLGFRLDFHVAHVLSWLLSIVAIYFLYQTLNYFFPKFITQLSVIPALVFFSFAQDENYVHYYSEGIAIILLSYCVYLIARWSNLKQFRVSELILFGLAEGLVVLCKIQALPLAFVLGVWSLILLVLLQRKKAILYGGILSLSVATVWGIWLGYMQANQLLNDFIFYYITANAQLKIHFSEGPSIGLFSLLLRSPKIIFSQSKELRYFFFPFFLLGGVFIIKHFSKTAFTKIIHANQYFWVMIAGYLLMVLAVIVRTGSFYPHHFLFFILPCTLLIGLFLQQLSFPGFYKWGILGTQLLFVGIGIKRILSHSSLNAYPTAYSRQNELSAVGKAILKYKKDSDYLVVWGWSCEYHVETQMPQGVNENHSVRTAMKHPLQPIYYQRYMKDLKRTHPKVFVDAITSKTLWMNDPKKYGHQNYPELALFIANNYTLKEEIDGVRVYVAR